MINKLIIDISLIIALFASIINFIIFFRKNQDNKILISISRLSYILLSSLIVVASIILMLNIIGHNFQISYIYNYSSKELPLHLLLSSFFAGQEGSMLLWVLFFIITGFVLMKYTANRNYEHISMALFELTIAAFLLILIVRSPFDMIWETYPNEGINELFIPQNGRGINPILENFWMIIHPPILFIGYTAVAVPYILAIAALFKKDYNNWINLAIPWTLFANALLGLGIILGGVWAYETLGWGGFWGWDPVENSSLIPWIVTITLSHTLLVQKRTGALVKTNLALAIISFSLVLYAVFLTRSGVMSDTSVHSFGEVGGVYYDILLRVVLIFFIIGVFFLAYRSGSIKSERNVFSKLNRETFLVTGAIVLLAAGTIVFIGTSYPVFTKLVKIPTATADISFYNKWNLPLAIMILLLSGFGSLFKWKQESIASSLTMTRFYIPLISSFVISLILYLLGLERLDLLFLAFSGIFATIISALFLKKKLTKSLAQNGVYFSHIGFAILMFGIIGSGTYSRSQIVSFSEGETKNALGYELTYLGKTRIETNLTDREKYQYNIILKKGNSESRFSPVFYLSDYNRRESYFLQPDVKVLLHKDIYISPVNIQKSIQANKLILEKNQKSLTPLDSSTTIEFLKFDMSQAMSEANENTVNIGAIIHVQNDSANYEDTLITKFDVQTFESEPVWKYVKGRKMKVSFAQLIRNNASMAHWQALFVFSESESQDISETELLTIEISIKPLINLVWLGSILIFFGFFMAIFRYKNKIIIDNHSQ